MNTAKQLAKGRWQMCRVVIAASTLAFVPPAFAQEKNCVTLKTEAHMEQDYTDAQGKPAKRLVAPGKVVPGNEIIWTITATNTCDKPAEKAVIENAVPEHMTYIADSAMGPGTDITYSLNGREFKKASELSVSEAGKSRPARPDEIKSIRWVVGVPIAPKSMAYVRYRAKVK
jgi:uncharacterized repeat protein (TIGR01451 family)